MSAMEDLTNATPDEADAKTKDAYKRRLRLQREARREVDAELNPPKPKPSIETLDARLRQRVAPTPWRIVDWMKVGHYVLLVAQYKAGKTTLIINLVRSLLDDVPFLDTFDVAPVRRIVLFDFEMADEERGQLDDWYHEAGVQSTDRLHVVPMRGRGSAFDILEPTARAEWASLLRDIGADFAILDCIRPVMDALGLDENREAGRFLNAYTELLQEAGIREGIAVQHMGHQNERARGDSRFLDWPDAFWTLVREDDNPASRRFIKAFGRGVEVAEVALDYNPANHRMALGTGSRSNQKALTAIPDILTFVANEQNPPTGTAIRKKVHEEYGHSDRVLRVALDLAVSKGKLTKVDQGQNKFVYKIPTCVIP